MKILCKYIPMIGRSHFNMSVNLTLKRSSNSFSKSQMTSLPSEAVRQRKTKLTNNISKEKLREQIRNGKMSRSSERNQIRSFSHPKTGIASLNREILS